MEESYKENRSKFARQIHTIRKERNSQIYEVWNLSISDELKKECKKEIMENFYNKMKGVQELPWYQESRDIHLQDIQERIDLIKRKNLKLNLFWDDSAVIEDLKKNHYISVEKDKEKLGKKWYVIHIEFPSVWDFKGYSDSMFISYDKVTGDLDPKYKEVCYSFQDCKRIFDMFGAYLKEYWVKHIYWFRGPNLKWSYDYWVEDYFEINSYYSFLMHYFKRLLKIDNVYYSGIIDCRILDTTTVHDDPCRYVWDYNRRDWDFSARMIGKESKQRLLLHYNDQ